MAHTERPTRKSSFDLIKQAIETGGYPYELERVGRELEMRVKMPGSGSTITTMKFGPDGEVLLPPELRAMLRQRGASRSSRMRAPEPEAPQEGFRPSSYRLEDGRCDENGPCPGLQALMGLSCVNHGGIIGMCEEADATTPDYVGFIPSPGHRDGRLLVFNFCPCCGYDLRAGLAALDDPSAVQ